MPNRKTIVITWMDGPVRTYENSDTNVLNGVLHVYPHRKTGSGAWVLDGEPWHFPLSNIRAWGPEEWGGQHGVLLTVQDEHRG